MDTFSTQTLTFGGGWGSKRAISLQELLIASPMASLHLRHNIGSLPNDTCSATMQMHLLTGKYPIIDSISDVPFERILSLRIGFENRISFPVQQSILSLKQTEEDSIRLPAGLFNCAAYWHISWKATSSSCFWLSHGMRGNENNDWEMFSIDGSELMHGMA